MIGIHQLQFIPWVPYFFKIIKSDIFVFLNDVQYQKNGIQNRNQIKTPNGAAWLTLPVKAKLGELINEIEIANFKSFEKIMRNLEMNYKKSPFFFKVYSILESAFSLGSNSLSEINYQIICSILELLECKTKCFLSSQFKTSQAKEMLVLEIIEYFNEKVYISGKGAFSYMDINKFQERGIDLYIYDFNYSNYPQLWKKRQGFIPDLSIIDLMFNHLDEMKSYIERNGTVYQLDQKRF